MSPGYQTASGRSHFHSSDMDQAPFDLPMTIPASHQRLLMFTYYYIVYVLTILSPVEAINVK
jgi:hypothetical protein